jgi:PAS domain S-box-containing protein
MPDEQGQPHILANVIHDMTRQLHTEAELREIEERFRQITNSIHQMFWIMDAQTRQVIYVSPAYEQMSGYTAEQLYTDPSLFMYSTHPDDRARVEQDFQQIPFRSLSVEHRIIRADGTIRWVWSRAEPVRDEHGTLYRLVGIAEDITERKRSEAALRESEERFRQLAENIQSLFTLRDMATGQNIYISPSCEMILGISRERLYRDPGAFIEAVHPEDRERIRQVYLQYETDVEQVIDQTGEFRIIRPDGAIRWIEARAFPVYDEQGAIYRIVSLSEDITERKQLERELALREQRLNAFFTAASAGLVLFDEHLRYVRINETAARMTGHHKLEDYPGKTMFDMLPDMAATLEPIYQQVLDSGEPVLSSEVEGETPGQPGVLRAWQLSVFPIPGSNGKPTGVGAIFVEITERKQAEEALQRAHDELEQRVAERTAELSHTNELLRQENMERIRIEAALEEQRASLARQVAEQTADLKLVNMQLARAARLKDEFLANMSHELRTPLNVVLGLSEALLEGVYGLLSDRQRSALHNIESSGRHLLDMINDILDLAKIGAGKLELDIDIASIEAVCQASLRLIRHSASKKRISVSENIDPAATILHVDQRRLKQILVNLLSNAVKFTPEGGQVGLDVYGDRESQSIHFSVWDTGMGVAQEDMEKLFQPFVQLDSSLTKQHEGTGLGLALVAQLVEMHGGSLSVTSEVGTGSRFTVLLPWHDWYDPEEKNAEMLQTAPSESPVSVFSTLQHVLVIEDSPTAADQLTRYLSELGVRASVIDHGTQAVQKAMALLPDVIILDILLPDMSGWKVLKALRAEPQTRDIPILIISVLDERERDAAAEADAYLVKPISRAQLHGALFSILPRDQRHQAAQTTAKSPGEVYTSMPLVLLVEDNEDNIEMLSQYLRAKHYRCELARNGMDAIKQATMLHPHLILMDIQMPGMDGLEAIRHIRNHPELADVPIIALTALAMPGDRERCLEAGANAYISKPISLKYLLYLVETHCQNRRHT